MIQFFGIMLKISIQDLRLGGYAAYWNTECYIYAGRNYTVEMLGIKPWARDIMTKYRFKQIRAAFRPENDITDVGDKCHQLRFTINKFNQSARRTFIPGYALSFDEGGHACRSRYCPVRQYNKDKPNKYRVDFFILSDALKYFICHLDVYQGRNGANVGIHDSVKNMPTT